MSIIVLDHQPSLAPPATHRIARLIRLVLRQQRQRRERQAVLRAILAETRDPHVLADLGVEPPAPNLLERFPLALADMHR